MFTKMFLFFLAKGSSFSCAFEMLLDAKLVHCIMMRKYLFQKDAVSDALWGNDKDIICAFSAL